MSTFSRSGFALLLGVVALGLGAQANTITNTFDFGQTPPPGGMGPNAPAATTPVNGLHALGVTFGFTEAGDPSAAALYGDTIGADPDELAPLTDPVLDGPGDGVLTLTFDWPTTSLSFDIAFPADISTAGAVVIGGNSFPITTTDNSGLFGLFSIGSFQLTTSSSFTQTAISFNGSAFESEFAIDNLSYSYSVITAPEPESMICLGTGAVLAILHRRRRRDCF